jgi:hypothetical protein
MAMSRKHYVQVARIIRDNVEFSGRQFSDHGASYAVGVSAVARDLADMFRQDNPAFDRSRFYMACGLDDEGYAV